MNTREFPLRCTLSESTLILGSWMYIPKSGVQGPRAPCLGRMLKPEMNVWFNLKRLFSENLNL